MFICISVCHYCSSGQPKNVSCPQHLLSFSWPWGDINPGQPWNPVLHGAQLEMGKGWSQRQHSSWQELPSGAGLSGSVPLRTAPTLHWRWQPKEGGVLTHSFWARAAVVVQRLLNDKMEIWSKQSEPQAPGFWIAVISHLFFKQGILMLCRITVWGMLPSISLILCKFTSNSYCQNTVWHLHSTCFFSDEHKATSVQREYVASPWVTLCECWRLWNILWNWASHKHFIFQKQSHCLCHSAWRVCVCRLGAST